MADKIASVLNKVTSTYQNDKYATPLRIQRDFLYGPDIYPPEQERMIFGSG